MSEKPIIFGAWAIPGLLNDSITLTLRPIVPQPAEWNPADKRKRGYHHLLKAPGVYSYHVADRYNVGDLLWVKETFQVLSAGYEWVEGFPTSNVEIEDPLDSIPDHAPRVDAFGRWNDNFVVAYKAYGSWDEVKWRSPIHMPRWAARIWLGVTDVRVMRIWNLNATDIESCGIFSDEFRNRVGHLVDIWNVAYAKRGYAYDTNPWVYAVSFRRIDHA